MADPGKGPGGPGSPLFLEQTEVRRAEKNFLETGTPPSHLRVGMTLPPPLSEELDPPLGLGGEGLMIQIPVFNPEYLRPS